MLFLTTPRVPKFCVLLLVLLSTSIRIQASFFDDYMVDPDDGMLDASQYLTDVPMGFLPVPTIITEPATGNGLGLVGIFFHESDEQKKQPVADDKQGKQFVLPHNISLVGLGATENGSKAAGLGHMGFWLDDTLRYKGFLLFPDFNLDFYSLGGNDLPSPIELNVTGPMIIQNLKARLGKSHWFAGVHQIFREVSTSLAHQPNFNLLPSDEVNEQINSYISNKIEDKTITSGLGLILEYDSRNNPMNPERGYDYQIEITRFDSVIGSDIDYDSYHFEGLNYWKLSKQFNFGLRLQFDEVSTADDQQLPSYIPPSIDLRGVPAIRYQGNQVAVGEVELTWKLNQRWRFNTFTGAGRAATDFDELANTKNINNYGVGFRYLIAKRYGFIMGTDFAKGPEDSAIYIQAGSTW